MSLVIRQFSPAFRRLSKIAASEGCIFAGHQISHKPRIAPKLFKMLEKYIHKTDQSRNPNTCPAILRQLLEKHSAIEHKPLFFSLSGIRKLEKIKYGVLSPTTEEKTSPCAQNISKQNYTD